MQAEIDLLLHPRVPPLVRSLPHVETLSLFRAEEGEEELNTRRRVALDTLPDRPDPGSNASESPTPLGAGRTSLWNTSRQLLEAAKNAGASSSQVLGDAVPVPMQIDAPAAPVMVQQPSQLPAPPSVGLRHPQSPPLLAVYPAVTGHLAQLPLPPPPDPLPSRSAALGPKPTTASIPTVTQAAPVPAPVGQGDDSDDEPMPTIDLGSDSESE